MLKIFVKSLWSSKATTTGRLINALQSLKNNLVGAAVVSQLIKVHKHNDSKKKYPNPL